MSIVAKFVKFRNVTKKRISKKRQGEYLVNRGVQIATRLTWAFQEVP